MGTPTKAKATKFTKLQAGQTGTPTGFETIGEVKSFDGPNGTAPQIDVSNFDSPEAEFVPGLSMPGELQMTMNFVGSDTMQQQLDSDRVAGTSRYYKLELADHASSPTSYTFLASVTAFSLSGATNGVYEAKATLKISGSVTKTYRPS
jgi:hypothetical protein